MLQQFFKALIANFIFVLIAFLYIVFEHSLPASIDQTNHHMLQLKPTRVLGVPGGVGGAGTAF